MRLIQLPGDSPPLYVSKSSFLQSHSSGFDWNDEESVLFPNWETGITWFESVITFSSQLLRDLFNFLVNPTTLSIQIKLLTKWFILFWLERRRSCPIPRLGNWNHLIWKWDNFFIPTPMRFIQLPGESHHFVYPNQVSYKVIHPGLIGTTKKLSYSQTGKLESHGLKVG